MVDIVAAGLGAAGNRLRELGFNTLEEVRDAAAVSEQELSAVLGVPIAAVLAPEAPDVAAVLHGHVDQVVPNLMLQHRMHFALRECATAAIEAQLNEGRVTELHEQGASLTTEEAAAYALDAISTADTARDQGKDPEPDHPWPHQTHRGGRPPRQRVRAAVSIRRSSRRRVRRVLLLKSVTPLEVIHTATSKVKMRNATPVSTLLFRHEIWLMCD